MSAGAPIPCRWTGETMQPVPRFSKNCDARFIIGAIYTLEEVQQRSMASHRFYFASVNEAWKNLPESETRFPSADHLRKWALIQCGFHDQRIFVASSKAEALRIAAFLRPVDDYSVVLVKDAVVSVLTAKSQSLKAMGKDTFRASMDAVLGLLSEMVGVTPAELEGAGRSEAA